MKRQITIFFLIFLFVKSTHGQENKSNDYEAEGKVDQHAYQDILIEYNFENGEEKWYLKEVGGSHLIPYNNNQNDPYAPKIRTRRHIYMRLLNYNPNLISFSAKFDNKEYASNSALKGDFMDYVKSVNGFESKSNNLPDQEQKVSDIISKGEQIDEELNKTAQLLRTTPIKKEEKSVLAYTFSNISNSSNIVNAIIRTLDEASNIKVVPSDS